MNIFACMSGALGLILSSGLGAQETTAQDPFHKLEERVKALEGVADTTAMPAGSGRIVVGNNAWMLVSAALVLMMTGPGLALFYGGLVRRKNVLSTFMHSMFLMGLMTLLWFVYGYSLSFGKGTAFFGSFTDFLFLKGVGAEPNATYAGTIPHQTFMLFQLMFAIITPALISGAFAERIKFSAMLIFTVLWATVVYFPMAHMVWGEGGLFNWALGGRIPALDFAGGTVVHISSGVSALVCALVMGRRVGYPGQPMPPHNVVYSMMGAGLLWVGWFGFNAGSALMADGVATSAFAATHFASAAAMLSWTAAEWIHRGKPSALGAVSGLVAGLVVVTPAAGFVSVPSAVLMGLIGGLVCFLSVAWLKPRFGYDDSLDAFGVHGVGGTLGALLTGLFASKDVNSLIGGTWKAEGAATSTDLSGGAPQLLNQLYSVAITWALAGVATFVILKVVHATVGLRPSEPEEQQGLDLSLHGEQAYNG
jgi:ammonium transporter, Amt family